MITLCLKDNSLNMWGKISHDKTLICRIRYHITKHFRNIERYFLVKLLYSPDNKKKLDSSFLSFSYFPMRFLSRNLI